MKKRILLFLTLFLCVLSFGCATEEKKENEIYIYYLNADGNGLIQDIYPKLDVQGMLDKMKNHNVLPKGVKVENYEVKNDTLSLYFNDEYYDMKKSKEVLVRAAIVQTMTQLDDIEFVMFYVENDGLRDNEGNLVGMMSPQDFVQNTGSSIETYQTIDLKLYFSDKDGTKIKEISKSNIRYNVNTAIEKLVIEQLMKGTSATGVQPVIPTTTKLLGVSVKDGVCYVNFDSKFVTDSYNLNPEVAIYSIVNSVIANGNVTKVQILVDGANDVVYKNKVDLSRPLEWKLDIVKE